MNYYLAALKKYATFSGRAQRAEYWTFSIVNTTVLIGLTLIGESVNKIITNLAVLLGLAILLPSIAVSVRRLHDTDRSGWWVLIGLIPYVGAIVMLVFTLFDSKPGDNKYGPNPKGIAAPIPVTPPAPAS
ncbi:DUF805 domain-containing protein [Candidatus Uhrbacteria bacterium]|nr:DUF805 domain-containing protein [Candidatus Uhrbacteria bacterium]